jgi:uncharacterized protein
MQYLIMHGSFGSPQENWFPWLERMLVKTGNQVVLKQFPVDDWEEIMAIGNDNIASYTPKQSLSTWETFFVAHILPIIRMTPTTVIAHSIAPVFLLHMLAKYEFELDHAVFVAPFFTIPDRPEIWQFYPVNKTFYSSNFDFEPIKKRIHKSTVVYGDDDPYVPSSEPPLFAQKLGSDIHVVPGGKHCGGNFTEFPLILDILRS